MLKKLIVLFITVIWLCGTEARSTPRRSSNRNMEVIPFYGGTSFDYDYGVDSKRLQLQRTSPTTRRPFIKYWRNLLRNVRLSIPTITWNVTNPFTNIFTDGAPSFIETPINQEYDEYSSNVQKRKRKSQRRKTSKRDKRRRTKPTNYDDNNEEQHDVTDADDDNNINDYYKEQTPQMQQYLLRPYDSDNVRKPVLLYDPRTDQYYEIQSMRTSHTQLQNAGDLNVEKPIVTTDHDEFIEIVGTKASDEVNNDVKTLSADFNNASVENTKVVVTTTEIPESENIEGTLRNAQTVFNKNDLPQIVGKSRNTDFTSKTKGNSRKSHGWKTFLYYFIPQYI